MSEAILESQPKPRTKSTTTSSTNTVVHRAEQWFARFQQPRRRSPRLLLVRRNSFGGLARKPTDRAAIDVERSRRGFLRRVVVRPAQKSHRGRPGRREMHDQ